MQAVHILIDGVRDEYEAAIAEMLLRFVDGVKDVASIRSLHLVSVLYDETVANIRQILRTLRDAGFSAKMYRPKQLSRVSALS